MLFTALAAVLPAAAAAQAPSRLTFFGDSFTDTGNGDILTFPLDLTPTPPYAPGVITDGPNWAQLFAGRVGRAGDAAPSLAGGRNYAIGTARTGPNGAIPGIGMLAQVGAFSATAPVIAPAELFVLYGGANDVFDAGDLGTAPAQEAAITAAVDNLFAEANGLYLLGARNILIPNVADVSLAPEALTSPAGLARLSELSDLFNQLLATRIAALSVLPGLSVFDLSLDTLFDNIVADAGRGGSLYGITNLTVPCFLAPPGACAQSAFVDNLHPTTVVHELIADAAFRRVVQGVDVAAIPEPSTVVLLAGGLALLAGVARRWVRR
jgi:outer membrane lipase/esterase